MHPSVLRRARVGEIHSEDVVASPGKAPPYCTVLHSCMVLLSYLN